MSPAAGRPAPILFHEAARCLDGLVRGVDLRPRDRDLHDLLRGLTATWGERSVRKLPRWSCVTDDASPFEFSVAVGRAGVGLRMLVEAQADPPSPAAYFEAGCALNEWLEREHGADLDAFRVVEDLFRPTDGDSIFAMWHATALRGDGRHRFKIYLNPAARGRERALSTVEEACRRLGWSEAWHEIRRSMRPEDRPHFFALGLSPEAGGAVYLRHPQPTVGVLARAAAVAQDHVASEVASFVETMAGSTDLRRGRPPITAYRLAAGHSRPVAAVTHWPCIAFTPHDGAAAARVRALLDRYGLPHGAYERCLSVLARRPLEGETLVHSYVSLQREDGAPRLTAYLCPRVYLETFGPLALDPPVMWPYPALPSRVPRLTASARPGG